MAFGLQPSYSAKDMATRLEEWLVTEVYKTDGYIVLFIDEAQSIASRALPIIRDLVNLEAGKGTLLQIILSAQTTIDQKLSFHPALQSRISTVVKLEELTEDETDAMILHRLSRAGCWDPTDRFPADTMRMIYQATRGNPRDIMVVTETAMREAYIEGCARVLPAHIDNAVKELSVRKRKRRVRLTEAV